jgi:hypothetical protein
MVAVREFFAALATVLKSLALVVLFWLPLAVLVVAAVLALFFGMDFDDLWGSDL